VAWFILSFVIAEVTILFNVTIELITSVHAVVGLSGPFLIIPFTSLIRMYEHNYHCYQ